MKDLQENHKITPWHLLCQVAFACSLLYILFSLFFYLLGGEPAANAFPLIKNIKMLPPHADMRWVTALSECGVDLQALAEGRLNGCDPYQRGGLGYPPMSVQIARFLAVKGSHTGILAFSMGLANVIILCSLYFELVKDKSLRYIATSIMLLSFPLQLALERGNIDIVIFNVFAIISALIASNKSHFTPLICALSWLVVAIKIYPFPSIILWSFLDFLEKKRLQLFNLAILIGGTIGIVTSLPWFITHGESAARPEADIISHALISSYPWAQNLANKLSHNYNTPLVEVLSRGWGLLMFLTSLCLARQLNLNRYYRQLIATLRNPFQRHFFYHFIGLCSSTWLSSYILSGSFDYRMIFALPGFACIISYYFSNFRSSRHKGLMIVLAFATASILLSQLSLTSPINPSQAPQLAAHLNRLADYIFIPLIAALLTTMLLPDNWNWRQNRDHRKMIGSTESTFNYAEAGNPNCAHR
jgi:hypothetical protein